MSIGLIHYVWIKRKLLAKSIIFLMVLLFICIISGYAEIYNVGPDQAYISLSEIPWFNLLPGDTVRIHYRAAPYREIIGLRVSGTASDPIRICGIKGPNGELPVLSGQNAVIDPRLADFFNVWNENLGIFVIQGPWGDKPGYIEIEGLKIMGANPQNSFTNENGVVVNYAAGAASVYVVAGENITIRGCEITDNGNGIFTNSTNNAEERTTRDVLIENNYIYGNGNDGSYRHHNLYIQSAGAVIQYNRIGRLRAGAVGSSLKDRSAGTVIRYNWIESAARTLDLVEPEDAEPVLAHPDYHRTFVYGNILINEIDDSDGYAYASNMVHYGGDNSVSGDVPPACDICRKGKLYFFNNTVVVTDPRTGGGYWRQVRIFELSTHDETADIRNNIFYLYAPNGETILALMDAYGVANLEGTNWIMQDWDEGHWRDFIGQVNVNGTLIEGTNPQFADNYYHLSESSPCIDAGENLPDEIMQYYNLTLMYQPHQEGVKRAASGAAIDLGAYEYQSLYCEGDFDQDGDVDGRDLAVFASDFGRTDCCGPDAPPCEGDFDKDCDVDGRDLAVFAANFGRTSNYKCFNEITY